MIKYTVETQNYLSTSTYAQCDRVRWWFSGVKPWTSHVRNFSTRLGWVGRAGFLGVSKLLVVSKLLGVSKFPIFS